MNVRASGDEPQATVPNLATQDLLGELYQINAIPRTAARDDCPICLNHFTKECIKLPCAHKFCDQCIQGWLTLGSGKSTCPLCRVPFTQADVVDAFGSDISASAGAGSAG